MSQESKCTGYHIRSTQGDELWIGSLNFSTGAAIGFQARRCTRQEADNLIGKTWDECLEAIRISPLTPQPPSDNNLSG